jgi:phage/plasmid-associated DNA primase
VSIFNYDDEAMRHRLTVVPFNQQFEKDAAFQAKMKGKKYLDALLTLMCEGAKDHPTFHSDEHPSLSPTTTKSEERKHLLNSGARR